MTGDELHRVTTIAKAEAVIELLWTHLYDSTMSYHHEEDKGAQGYMGGMTRMVLDQMDGLMDEMVTREEVHDDAPRCGTCRYYADGICNEKNFLTGGQPVEPYHSCGMYEVKNDASDTV